MTTTQIDPSSGCHLIGGELLEWTDFDPPREPGALGVLVRDLIGRHTPEQAVLLGPTAGALLQLLPRDVAATVIVRGLPDARRVASLAPLRTQLDVLCGDLSRVPSDLHGDLVIALDPMEVLLSPDSRGMTHLQALARLRDMVSPDGTLVFLVNNQLSATRIAELDMRTKLDANDQWFRGADGFDLRDLYHRDVEAWLEQTQGQHRLYAAWPATASTSMLVSGEVTSDTQIASLTSVIARRLEGQYFAKQPALMDPFKLAQEVIESGLALELAPGWVGVVSPTAEELPPLLVAETDRRDDWRMITRVTKADGGWHWTGKQTSGSSEVAERRVGRDFSAAEQPLTDGVLLETALRRAASGVNLRPVRELVQRYAAWMRDPAHWEGDRAQLRPFASPDNVVVLPDGSLKVFDPTWRWYASMDADTALAAGLRSFCFRLLRSGAEHQWKADISPNDLAETFGVMVDLPWTSAVIDTIARFESEVEAVLSGRGAVAEAQLLAANLESGGSQFTAVPGPSRGYRESLAKSGALAQELHERAGQVDWLEATLRTRDLRVGELERTLGDVRDSISFKTGRALTYPGRAVFKLGRRAVEGALPPGLMYKAQRVLRRVAR